MAAQPKPKHKTNNELKGARVYLIDGYGYVFRAYHALPPLTRKSDGAPVGAAVGFANMLNKLLEDEFVKGDGTHVAVVFDAGAETFRNDIFEDYKANRDETPDDLIPQFDFIHATPDAFGITSVEQPGFEADDLIATYARLVREAGGEAIIVSSDKDLMQLVGPSVTMFDPMKNRRIGPEEVREKFGVGPNKVVEVQALAGDPTDNVPGVPGIGIKTAALLINEYGDVENLLEHAGEIKQTKRRENLIEFAEDARMSRELVMLRDDVEVDDDLTQLTYEDPDAETLLAFLDEMEFQALAARVRKRLDVDDAPPEAATATAGEVDTTAISSLKELAKWAKWARTRGRLALATFTSRPGALRSPLAGLAIAIDAGRAAYVPIAVAAPAESGDLLNNPAETNSPGLPCAAVIECLKPVLEDPGVLKIGHDIKTDMLVFGRLGVAVHPIEDTMLLSYALEAGQHGHARGAAAKAYLDQDMTPNKDVVGSGKSQIGFDEAPLDDATQFAGEAVETAANLHRTLKPRLVAEHLVSVYETMDRPLVPVLADMERAGVRVDPAVLKGLSDDFAARIDDIGDDIYKLAGREFNIGSPKQLGEVLFDELGLPAGKKSKTGAYSTSADILERLSAEGHDLPQRVLDWRQLAKLKNTYTDALPGEINPDTGRIHTTYAMAVAPTGRLSSVDPNLQNIPIRSEEGRRIRCAFVPAAGHSLLSADYSQIELRLLSHYADIPALRAAFRDGADIHAMTASEVFGVPVEGMDASVRRRAKAINFGIIYGISPFGLARQLGIAQREAKDYIDTYFERYPGIRDYMESRKELCREHGYVETIFGRRCHLPGIRDRNPVHRAFSERASINAPLQGSAADIIKRAMVRIPGALATAKLGARMLLQVHDELIFEVPDGEADDTAALVKGVMEGAAHLEVPMTVDTGTGANWDEAH
jgi:DNA polymerase-1